MTHGWSTRLRPFAADFLREHPALTRLASEAAVLLHGSTTLGIDDPYSDLDVWVLVSDDALATLEESAGTRFFEFALGGKPGHFTVETASEFQRRVQQCDFPLIAELRLAEILADPDGVAVSVVAAARQPMRDAVRRARFCYHYVEMRSEHRACDNPIERGDAVAILQAMVPTVARALRAAMVLDGEPYPYVKWLSRASSQTPTGSLLAPKVTEILDLLAQDVLRLPGPEKEHPLSRKLRDIRALLIEAARARGIDEPWLDRWWFSIGVR